MSAQLLAQTGLALLFGVVAVMMFESVSLALLALSTWYSVSLALVFLAGLTQAITWTVIATNPSGTSLSNGPLLLPSSGTCAEYRLTVDGHVDRPATLEIADVRLGPYTSDVFPEGKHYITLFAIAVWIGV